MTTVLAFIVTLGILIVIHEYGHFRVARACGVKVLRFSVGFGRVIWRRQRSADATEYTLSMLPLGGYVRMLDSREGPVPASQLHEAFDRKTLWQRTAIVAAGPAANLALAVLLYALAGWVGINEPRAVLGAPLANSLASDADMRAGDWVRAVDRDGEGDWQPVDSLTDLRWQVTQAALNRQPLTLEVTDADGAHRRIVTLPLSRLPGGDLDAEAIERIGLGGAFRAPLIGRTIEGGPADRAGLREGDRVLSVDGQPIDDAQALYSTIRAHTDGTAMTWTVAGNGGAPRQVTVTPSVAEDQGRSVGRIEAYLGGPVENVTVRYGPIEGLTRGIGRTWDIAALSLRMMGRMIIGEASVKNLSGPLTIADFAGQSVERGFSDYIGFLAMVSVSLGVLNLLPLPMLDGGHLMYYLFEGVTGRPVSDLWHKWLQRGGALVLLLMMSIALSNDVTRLLGLQ